jgi:3-isopropylmalate dehydrogenase
MSNKTYNIAVIPGDGTGPEVVREAIKVLNAAAAKYSFKLNYQEFDFGGDRYLRTGEILPESATAELKKFDSILLGAIGHPGVKPGILEKGILLKLRFELDQYINLRPVKLYPGVPTPLKDKGPEHIDYVVVRENSGDVYTGMGGTMMKGTPDEVAVQNMVYSRMQVDRCLRYAFEFTRKRAKRNTLACVAKPMYLLTYLIYGRGLSTKWARKIIPISNANTSMLMQHVCGWSKIPNGLMLLLLVTCLVISLPILGQLLREEWELPQVGI